MATRDRRRFERRVFRPLAIRDRRCGEQRVAASPRKCGGSRFVPAYRQFWKRWRFWAGDSARLGVERISGI